MPECLIRQTGAIEIDNVSGNAYVISGAGVTATIGGDFVISDVSAGPKQIKVVEQPDGEPKLIDIEVLPCDTALITLR